MNQILVLVQNTIKKEFTNKLLIFMFAVTVLIIYVLGNISDFVVKNISMTGPGGQQSASAVSAAAGGYSFAAFFFLIQSWNALLAVLVTIGGIGSDYRYGVITQILSQPLPRWKYLVSRIAGSYLIILAYYVISLALAFVFLSGNFSAQSLTPTLAGSFAVAQLVILFYITVSVIMALYVPQKIAFFLVFILALFLHYANYHAGALLASGESVLAKPVLVLATFAFPQIGTISKFSSFSFTPDASYSAAEVLGHSALFLAMLAAWFVGACFAYRRKDIS
ncbi:MAG TPA: hypothetical protein PKM65_10530 [Spirochaetota bacterium]|nr:hypothetical protein [Spirochaetota bacterium]HNT12263.1 hypothetical protein [Spirochaetota bacterium]HNV47052.1 hypothetical protein [Spirochaetota bacterium]HOS38613.1 hypothetical protein [Spirochaetota bacterium]HPI22797.1 hypothetical protein [Spirochaetota bacterium]